MSIIAWEELELLLHMRSRVGDVGDQIADLRIDEGVSSRLCISKTCCLCVMVYSTSTASLNRGVCDSWEEEL